MRRLSNLGENNPRGWRESDEEENKVDSTSPIVIDVHRRDDESKSRTNRADRVDHRSEEGGLI